MSLIVGVAAGAGAAATHRNYGCGEASRSMRQTLAAAAKEPAGRERTYQQRKIADVILEAPHCYTVGERAGARAVLQQFDDDAARNR